MPSTLTCLNYHIIFGTKNHNPCIDVTWRKHLHAYLGGCLREAQCLPLAINGVADHVHILCGLRAVHSVAAIMRDIKSASSRWVHETAGNKRFGWQEGYGAFSVSYSALSSVKRYIENQEEHHRKMTFREKYLEFLDRHEISYDEKYVL